MRVFHLLPEKGKEGVQDEFLFLGQGCLDMCHKFGDNKKGIDSVLNMFELEDFVEQ